MSDDVTRVREWRGQASGSDDVMDGWFLPDIPTLESGQKYQSFSVYSELIFIQPEKGRMRRLCNNLPAPVDGQEFREGTMSYFLKNSSFIIRFSLTNEYTSLIL